MSAYEPPVRNTGIKARELKVGSELLRLAVVPEPMSGRGARGASVGRG
jgi:hypothetical protein